MTWLDDWLGDGQIVNPEESSVNDFLYEPDPNALDWQRTYPVTTEYGEDVYYTADVWRDFALNYPEGLEDMGIDPYEVAWMLYEDDYFTWEDWREFYGEN